MLFMWITKYILSCFLQKSILWLQEISNRVHKSYTLKNKGAPRCHRRAVLSKWFHKKTLRSEEPFCFTKDSLWCKKFIQIMKRQERDFKEPLTEWFFVGPKIILLWHLLKDLFKHLYFYRVDKFITCFEAWKSFIVISWKTVTDTI